MSIPRPVRALAGFTLAVLAACSDTTSPARLTHPMTTAATVQAVDSVFAVGTVAAFTSLGDLMDPASGLAPAAALVQATQPVAPRPSATGYAGAAERYRSFSGLASSGSLLAGGLIPDELKGKTFEWDTLPGHERRYVITDRPGAPADGVRFILYAINPLTHRPVEPLVEVGYVDLHDLSTETTRSLRIVVDGVGGNPHYVDYTVAGAVTPDQFVASAVGFIANGQSGADGRTISFDLAATLTPASFTFTASLLLDNPAVTITETTTASKSAGSVTLTIDFTLTEPGQKVQLLGSATVVDEESGTDGTAASRHEDDDGILTVDFEVRVNDQLFATIQGTAPDIRILGANGEPLTEEERHALRQLFTLPARVFNFFQDLLHPVRRCFRV